MPCGNPSPKLAISVDPEVHAGIVEGAREQGVSVSAWMTDAARRALVRRDGLRAVAEWKAVHGAFTEEELARPSAVWSRAGRTATGPFTAPPSC